MPSVEDLGQLTRRNAPALCSQDEVSESQAGLASWAEAALASAGTEDFHFKLFTFSSFLDLGKHLSA